MAMLQIARGALPSSCKAHEKLRTINFKSLISKDIFTIKAGTLNA
jgi:hypothetical protein